MPPIHSMTDDWTPAKLKDHRAWRAKMYQPDPQTPAPAIVPESHGVDASDQARSINELEAARVANLSPVQRLKELETDLLRVRSEIAYTKQKLWPGIGSKQITVEYIISTVAKFYGCSARDIKSARRTNGLCRPRHIATYLARDLTMRSLPDIGQRFGGREHTTILHGANKIAGEMKTDQWLCCEVAMLELILTRKETV